MSTVHHKGFSFKHHSTEGWQSRIDNVTVISEHDINRGYHKRDVKVVCFGTFDMFHLLHRQLLNLATKVGTSLVVYVYGKNNKHGVKLTDSVQQRVVNVAQYCSGLCSFSHLRVQRMIGKHLEQLRGEIELGEPLIVMGGVDQFQDYWQLLDICYTEGVSITAIDRGVGLCSSDLRVQRRLRRTALALGADYRQELWASFKGDGLIGGTSWLWRYTPQKEVDTVVDRPLDNTEGRILACFPGRTPCDCSRVRKILQTNQDMLLPLRIGGIYLLNYSEDGQSTRHHLQKLREMSYYSNDALLFTEFVLMPRCDNDTLWQVSLWGRSRGSVFVCEVENAFRHLCTLHGYSEERIVRLGRQVVVLTVSNLAPLDNERLFTTCSITGVNDIKALEAVEALRDTSNNMIVQTSSHCKVLVTLPREIWTLDHGRLVHVEDNDCHYTPLFIARGENEVDNSLYELVQETFVSMVMRTAQAHLYMFCGSHIQ